MASDFRVFARRPPLSTPINVSEPSTRHCGYIKSVTPSHCNSFYELYRHGGAAKHPSRPMLGWLTSLSSEYKWMTYREVGIYARRIARGLKRMGVGRGDHVGIYGKNCAGWVGAELAVSCIGAVVVPLYGSLGVGSVKYVVEHSEVKVVFCEDKVLGNLCEAVFEERDTWERSEVLLEKIVVFGGEGFVGGDVEDVQEKFGLDEVIVGLDNVIGTGDDPGDSVEAKTSLDDLHCIMYTSGTTGTPKGVMLKNESLVKCVESCLEFFGFWAGELTPKDVLISYLPLAHIYEQFIEAAIYFGGGSVGFSRGNPKLLLEDMLSLKPTFFPGVPRVFSRFQQQIISEVERGGWLTQQLFHIAYNIQLHNVQNLKPRNWILDSLVFNKIRDRILPRGRLLFSSSAPLSARTMDFLRVTLNVPLIQAYGLTESCGPALLEPPNNSVSGSVGGPIPFCQVKLTDVPEMNYYSTDNPPRGEICLKGPLIMSGYYKREKESIETFSEDGWFSTGDIGQWRSSDGALQIIDRKKNLFKLAQGEYISPETLEHEYEKCKCVSQIWVYGNSHKSKLVAIVVPDVKYAKKWAQAQGAEFKSLEHAVTKNQYKDMVLYELAQMCRAAGFKGYERIEDVCFETSVNDMGQGFTIENELLTPSLKLKRSALKNRYVKLIENMYTTM